MNWIQKAAAKLFGLEVKKATPVQSSTLASGIEVWSDWDGDRATQEGLKRSTWVYASVDRIATLISSVPLKIQRKKGDNWEDEPDHPIQGILNRPNDFMTGTEIAERWTQHMLLSGNALFWLNLDLSKGRVLEIWPIKPEEIKPVQSKKDFIAGYRWLAPSGETVDFPISEIVHWQFPDPMEMRWGLSPLEAAAQAVDMDLAAARWNRKVLLNDAKPPIAIMLSDKLTAQQMDDANKQVHKQMDSNGIRRAIVLGGATDVKPLAMTATDLDFLNGRRFSKEEIAAVFNVPPILLTVGEAATFANLDAAKRILWEDKALPMLHTYCTGFELSLFPYYQLDKAEYRIVPELKEVRALQDNLETEASTLKTKTEAFANLINVGVSAKEASEIAGIPVTGVAPPQKSEKKSLEMKSSLKEIFKRRGQWELEAKKRVAELLLEQGSAAAAAYVSGTPWERELRSSEWRELMEAIYQAVMEAEGAWQYSELLDATRTQGAGSFDVLADGVLDWIEEHAGEQIKLIEATTRTELARRIKLGVEAGEGAIKIAERIKAVHKDWADWRALRIARTEVNSAFAEAHQQSAEQFSTNNDVDIEKTWRAAKGNRTREEHAEMDGETVGLFEKFSNGLTKPSEPNCRCVVLYKEKK